MQAFPELVWLASFCPQQYSPSQWYGTLVPILNPMVKLPANQVAQAIADLGETERARRRANIQGTGKKSGKCREKGLIRVSSQQLWFDLMKAGKLLERIGKQVNAVLVQLWQKLKPEQ